MNIEKKNKDLRQLSNEIHKVAKKKGFWEDYDNMLMKMRHMNEFSKELIVAVEKAFVIQKIMLVVTELSEAVEADREMNTADWNQFENVFTEIKREGFDSEIGFQKAFEGSIKDSFEDELADAIIRILDLCMKLDIDIMKHVSTKLDYNKTRNKMHGGKKY